MKIVNPKYKNYSLDEGVGVASFASWDNPFLWSGLEKTFNIQENEYILGIKINDDGITALIGHKILC